MKYYIKSELFVIVLVICAILGVIIALEFVPLNTPEAALIVYLEGVR